MRRALAIPEYRRLLAAYTLNELAWSLGSVALSLLVLRRTGSALGAMAFFLSASFVPALIAPALVARVDHLPSRRVLPALYLLEAVAFGVLSALSGAVAFAVVPVLVLALADGVLAVSARALARAATTRVLTPAGLLREGNALTNTVFSVCFMAGPALAGVIVGIGGTRSALEANVAVFTAVAITLATARRLPRATVERTPRPGRLRGALTYARGEPVIRAVLSLQAAALAFFMMSMPVEVVFAERTLHAGAGGYGVLLASWGAGGVLGSAAFARWKDRPPRVLLAGGLGAISLGLLTIGTAPSLGFALAGGVIGGTGNGVSAVAARTTLQEHTADRWLGLMMALWESLNEAVPGVGIVLGGALAALAGPRVALVTAGLGGLAVTACVPSALRIVPAPERVVG